MAVVTRYARVERSVVFAALVRPETYPEWLVGCREIRKVDHSWPEPGSSFHHRVGLVGPLTIPDSTSVLEIEQDRVLSLEVRARPFVRARSTFRLEDAGMADGVAVTRITLEEEPIGQFAPLKPLVDPLIASRNIASLNALVAFLNTPTASRSDDPSRAAKSTAN
ncbi:MAG: hypothetical protein M3Z46_11525 [Actinomycetota bacterium]|nr:hypothetical protein [Actinomycetota bacterium]